MNRPKLERLQKRMATLGIASRRASEALIQSGRVSVNGKVVTEMGVKVAPNDAISVDGKRVGEREPMVVVMHKPREVLVSRTDPQNRKTVYDILPSSYPYLGHVGRLDYNTEGVMLFTNDGDLTQQLLDPKTAIQRIYHVKIRGSLGQKARRRLMEGIPLDGRPTRPISVERLQSPSKHDWLEIVLFEGKNRHVHRILEAVGHSVTRLIRIAFAGVGAPDLKPGEFRVLGLDEVSDLRKLVTGRR